MTLCYAPAHFIHVYSKSFNYYYYYCQQFLTCYSKKYEEEDEEDDDDDVSAFPFKHFSLNKKNIKKDWSYSFLAVLRLFFVLFVQQSTSALLSSLDDDDDDFSFLSFECYYFAIIFYTTIKMFNTKRGGLVVNSDFSIVCYFIHVLTSISNRWFKLKLLLFLLLLLLAHFFVSSNNQQCNVTF